MPQAETYKIHHWNNIYPSGVLLVLARTGRLDLGRRVFEGWGQP